MRVQSSPNAMPAGKNWLPIIGLALTIIGIVAGITSPEIRRLIGLEQPSTPPWLGIKFATVTDYVRRNLNIPDDIQGVLVGEISLKSPADDASLSAGDIILSANGEAIKTEDQFMRLMCRQHNGDTLRLKIWRDGNNMDTVAILGMPRK